MAENSYEQHGLEHKELPVIVPANFCVGCEPNWHENIELLYCAEGKGYLVCNGVEHAMEPGRIYVVNSNEIHVIYNVSDLRYYCMIVDAQFLRQNAIAIDAIEIKTVIHDQQSNAFFLEIMGQMPTTEDFYVTKIRGLVLLLMVRLLQCGARKRESSETQVRGMEGSVKAAVDYITKNYMRKLSLDEIAQEVGFNKCYLARNFKKATGMTIVHYINLTRCRTAKNLLQQKQLSVHQIASLCGFENASYFSKIFHRVMGQLPSQVESKEEK